MRFREKRTTKNIINLTSMVDMLFLILLFFLVTSTFMEQPNIKLVLPSTKHADTNKLEDQVLEISQDGQFFFQKKPVKREDVPTVLKNAFTNTKPGDKTLVLRADTSVPYGEIVYVMDEAKFPVLRLIVTTTIPKSEKHP